MWQTCFFFEWIEADRGSRFDPRSIEGAVTSDARNKGNSLFRLDVGRNMRTFPRYLWKNAEKEKEGKAGRNEGKFKSWNRPNCGRNKTTLCSRFLRASRGCRMYDTFAIISQGKLRDRWFREMRFTGLRSYGDLSLNRVRVSELKLFVSQVG